MTDVDLATQAGHEYAGDGPQGACRIRPFIAWPYVTTNEHVRDAVLEYFELRALFANEPLPEAQLFDTVDDARSWGAQPAPVARH